MQLSLDLYPKLIAALAVAALAGPARAASPFDGVYSGTSELTGGTMTNQCAQLPADFSARIIDGILVIRTDGQVSNIEIRRDGSFKDHDRNGHFLTGRVLGGKLTADISDDSCTYAWTLYRR